MAGPRSARDAPACVQLVGVNFHSQDYFAVNATNRRERLDTPFTHGVCDRGWVAGLARRWEL